MLQYCNSSYMPAADNTGGENENSWLLEVRYYNFNNLGFQVLIYFISSLFINWEWDVCDIIS